MTKQLKAVHYVIEVPGPCGLSGNQVDTRWEEVEVPDTDPSQHEGEPDPLDAPVRGVWIYGRKRR